MRGASSRAAADGMALRPLFRRRDVLTDAGEKIIYFDQIVADYSRAQARRRHWPRAVTTTGAVGMPRHLLLIGRLISIIWRARVAS